MLNNENILTFLMWFDLTENLRNERKEFFLSYSENQKTLEWMPSLFFL